MKTQSEFKKIVQTFAIAVPAPEDGDAGLVIPHLDSGELTDAVWIKAKGLVIHGKSGRSLIEVSPDTFMKYWSKSKTLQVLETDDGREDQCWLVDLIC